MIPRFAPTYTWTDLFQGIVNGRRQQVEAELCSRLAAMHDVAHVFLVSSARVALYALLKAYNRPGDVLMPAYNCIVVPEAVHFAGYNPSFVDIDRGSLNMTPDALMKCMSPAVSVVLATHLFGIPCDVGEIRRVLERHNVLVIEDAAPALGAEFRGRLVGKAADAAIISFQSTKVISGESGGALLTNNDALAGKLKGLLQAATAPDSGLEVFLRSASRKAATDRWVYSIAQRGYRLLQQERMYEVVPPHTRMPSDFLKGCPKFSANLVLNQLERLSWNVGRRRKLAAIYQEELSGQPLRLPSPPEGASPAWIQYPVQVKDKGSFYRYMQKNGVDLTWTYRYSCAESYALEGLENSREAAKTVLGLPTHPSITDSQAQLVCRTAKRYLTGQRGTYL